MDTAAILISRQALRPCAHTPWVAGAGAAVAWVAANGFRLLTSTGMQTWELLVALARDAGIAQTLIIPAVSSSDFKRQCEQARYDFDLDPRLVDFRPASRSLDAGLRPRRLDRDGAIVEQADVLLPVSIRARGALCSLIDQRMRCSHVRCIRDFETPYAAGSAKPSYTVSSDNLSSAMQSIQNRYIVHWTRASRGQWPTERPIDYYRALSRAKTYPRSAYATLHAILDRKVIIASNRHLPRDVRAVCFTAAPFDAFAGCMRWRKRYAEMSFEPYGIGVSREYADALGLEPVVYVDPGAPAPAHAQRWLCQGAGVAGDWRLEKEYRHLGDFSLSRAPGEALIALCHTAAEARRIETRFGIRAEGWIDG
jgi:hypothetical protein